MTEALRFENERLKRQNEYLARKCECLEHQVAEMTGADKLPPEGTSIRGAQFRIINLLAKSSPRLLRRHHLVMAAAPDPRCLPMEKCVDVHICKIRRDLKPYGMEIETIWGEGYRMLPDSAEHWLECVREGRMRPMARKLERVA